VLTPRQRLRPTPSAVFARDERWSLVGTPGGVTDRGRRTPIVNSALTAGTPLGLTFNGDVVTGEDLSILKGWLNAGDQFGLDLTLTELLLNSSRADLGAQTVPLLDVTLLFADRSEAIIEVGWATRSLQTGSAVEACCQVVINTGGGPIEFGDLKCVVFTQP